MNEENNRNVRYPTRTASNLYYLASFCGTNEKQFYEIILGTGNGKSLDVNSGVLAVSAYFRSGERSIVEKNAFLRLHRKNTA